MFLPGRVSPKPPVRTKGKAAPQPPDPKPIGSVARRTTSTPKSGVSVRLLGRDSAGRPCVVTKSNGRTSATAGS